MENRGQSFEGGEVLQNEKILNFKLKSRWKIGISHLGGGVLQNVKIAGQKHLTPSQNVVIVYSGYYMGQTQDGKR